MMITIVIEIIDNNQKKKIDVHIGKPLFSENIFLEKVLRKKYLLIVLYTPTESEGFQICNQTGNSDGLHIWKPSDRKRPLIKHTNSEKKRYLSELIITVC